MDTIDSAQEQLREAGQDAVFDERDIEAYDNFTDARQELFEKRKVETVVELLGISAAASPESGAVLIGQEVGARVGGICPIRRSKETRQKGFGR